MVTLEEKKKIVEDLALRLKSATGVYMVDFEKMDVATTNQFRSALRAKDIQYKVAKNTLIKKAFSESGKSGFPDDLYRGATGLVMGFKEGTEPAKILKDLIKKLEKPAFKAALIEGEFFNDTQLEEITKLPTKAQLIASILGSLDAPITGIVSSINATAQGLVNILNNSIGELATVIEEVAKKKNA